MKTTQLVSERNTLDRIDPSQKKEKRGKRRRRRRRGRGNEKDAEKDEEKMTQRREVK